MSYAWYTQSYPLLLLILVGVASTLYAGRLIFSYPSVGVLRAPQGYGLGKTLGGVLKHRKTRSIVVLSALYAMQALAVFYLLNYYANVVKFSTDRIFLISLIALFFSYCSSRLLAIIGDKISSKLLLWIFEIGLCLLGLAWAMMSRIGIEPTFVNCVILQSVTGVLMGASFTVKEQLCIRSMPDDNALQMTIVYQLATLAGALIGLGLFSASNIFVGTGGLVGFHAYSHIFFIWSVLALLVIVSSRSMGREGKGAVRDELSLLLPSNLLDMFRLSRLQQTEKHPQQQIILEGIMAGSTSMSRDLLLASLASSSIQRRYSAYHLLSVRPIQAAFPLVLKEATERDSPLQTDAITTLGFLRNPEATETLLALLKSNLGRTQVHAAKSLMRLGHPLSDECVLDLYRACLTGIGKVHLMIGIVESQRTLLYYQILACEFSNEMSGKWLLAMFQYGAALYGKRETMEGVFDAELIKQGEGQLYLISEIQDELGKELTTCISQCFANQNWQQLLGFFREHNQASNQLIGALDSIVTLASVEEALGLTYLWFLEQTK